MDMIILLIDIVLCPYLKVDIIKWLSNHLFVYPCNEQLDIATSQNYHKNIYKLFNLNIKYLKLNIYLFFIYSLSLENIVDADIAAAVPLISMGALLGRTTPFQLLFMAIIEIVLFALNEYVALNIFSVS